MNAKKFGRIALWYAATGQLFLAAATWRMSGIWNERVGIEGNAEWIAKIYGMFALFSLLTGLLIIGALALLKSHKH